MVQRLSCSGCGTTITAHAALTERELAICGQCNRVLRAKPAIGECLDVDAPAGVLIERGSDRSLSLRVRRRRGAWAFNSLTRIAGCGAGLIAAAACATSFGVSFGLLGIPAAVIGFVAAAKFQRQHQPLRLRAGLLHPSSPSHAAVAVGDLQQVYAAVCHCGLGGDRSYPTSNLFALTHKGERILLVGPLENEQVGEYIEQILELEIRRINLWTSSDGSYDIEEDGDGLSILPLEADPTRGSIELLGDRLVLRRIGSAPLTLSARELSEICAKPMQGSGPANPYRVTATHPEQGEIELLGAIHERQEAYEIAETLVRMIAKSA